MPIEDGKFDRSTLELTPYFLNRFQVVKSDDGARLIFGDSVDGGRTTRWRIAIAMPVASARDLEEALVAVLD